jgi:hypothetical protein
MPCQKCGGKGTKTEMRQGDAAAVGVVIMGTHAVLFETHKDAFCNFEKKCACMCVDGM